MNQPVENFALTAPGDPRLDTTRHIRAPRGSKLTCRNWLIEAAYRMIQNNLDPEVAENPDALVVYGGIGKAARNWAAFDKIVEELRALEPDQTLLVQSGKPVGVFIFGSPRSRCRRSGRGADASASARRVRVRRR